MGRYLKRPLVAVLLAVVIQTAFFVFPALPEEKGAGAATQRQSNTEQKGPEPAEGQKPKTQGKGAGNADGRKEQPQDDLSNYSPVDTRSIDKFGALMRKRIDRFGDRAAPVVGDWIRADVLNGIIFLELIVCGLIATLAILVERVSRVGFGRLAARYSKPGSGGAVRWKRDLAAAVSKPLSLFILIYGFYAAMSPIYFHFSSRGGVNPVQNTARYLADFGGTVALLWLVFRLVGVLDFRVMKWAEKKSGPFQPVLKSLITASRKPFRLLIFLIVIRLGFPLLQAPSGLTLFFRDTLSLVVIGTVAWLIINSTAVLQDLVTCCYQPETRTTFQVRRLQTQILFLKRFIITVVLVIALASMLMVFDKVRQLGASILTSAGIMGVVLGLAAQKSIANLLVGLQIAITQPIRIGDIVVIEKEWGHIEEIKSTYAIVKTWDMRRLIVPLTYFTDKTFENWTLTSSEVLAWAYVYADYRIPVDAIRAELWRILKESKFWDGRKWSLRVTNTTDKTIELRADMSAKDAHDAWELRCEVREKLVAFIQESFLEKKEAA